MRDSLEFFPEVFVEILYEKFLIVLIYGLTIYIFFVSFFYAFFEFVPLFSILSTIFLVEYNFFYKLI